MPTAMPYPEFIDQSATRKGTQRVLSAEYGDGYSHDTPDGINSKRDMWSNVTYPNMTLFYRNIIVVALESVGQTDYLTWAPLPGGPTKRFKITSDGYTETFPAGHLYTISFSLREVF